MSPDKKVRSFNGPSSSISTRIGDNGEVLIRVSAGAVSIVISVPPEQVAFLFSDDAAPDRVGKDEVA